MTYLPSDISFPAVPGPTRTRTINYLRISVTDRCNLACRYCVPKGVLPLLSHQDIARYEEIIKIIDIASTMGISKIRITGGEPFVRKGLLKFINEISSNTSIQDIAVTTNGVLLKKFSPQLRNSGINRINISLDTLKPERFSYITGHDRFQDVWEGIMAAHETGLFPIKLNAVILRGVNDDEIEDLAGLSLVHPFHIRFIEYMPMGNSSTKIEQQVLIPEIRQRIEDRFSKLNPISRQRHDGPATRFKIAGAPGEIGFISPVSSHFCHQCNRLRLTATGRLRPCLLHTYEKDILTPLRMGASHAELRNIIQDVIDSKPGSHSLTSTNDCVVNSQMSSIGG